MTESSRVLAFFYTDTKVSGMHISYRPAMIADIDCCVSNMLPRSFACPAEIRASMSKLWREWLLAGVSSMGIVEVRDRNGRERPIAFGLSVFVSDEFADLMILGEVAPPVAVALVRLADAGKSPVLTLSKVRRGNSPAGMGLNLLSPIIGWLPEIEADAHLLSLVKAKLLEALGTAHAGYKLRRLMQEIYGESEMKRGEVIGATLFIDYAKRYGNHLFPPQERAYLVGIERESIEESSTLWPLFLYTPPIIFFSNLEQEVLQLAAMGLADRQIAATLAVAQSTVHKRWHAVLRRAAPYAVVWMPQSERGAPESQGRGSEKRHYLLNYLKSHPEELRPAEAPSPTR